MAKFGSPDLLRALEDVEKCNYLAAFEALVPLAEANNPKAQCNLANLYHFGWGVAVDGKKAAALYLEVAEQNIEEECLSAVAYQNLATIYVTGLRNFEPNPEKAREFSVRARSLGLET